MIPHQACCGPAALNRSAVKKAGSFREKCRRRIKCLLGPMPLQAGRNFQVLLKRLLLEDLPRGRKVGLPRALYQAHRGEKTI